MHHRRHTLRERLEALLLAFLTLSWGACIPSAPIPPFPGFVDSGRLGWVAVPGGQVNTAGGNLLVSRLDLSLDTPLGTQEIGAVYNSTTGEWLWSFQTSYDGTRFVDPSGAVYDDVSPEGGLLTPGGTIPGTHWVRVDADTLKTKGGLAYHFDAQGKLSHIAWATLDYPRIEFTDELISQCTLATTCVPLFDVSFDGDGNPLLVTDTRTGRTASFGYDALGRLETVKSPFDIAHGLPGTRYEYSTGGTLLTAVVSSEGERIEYEYQAGRRILHVTQIGEGDPRHRFEFYGVDAGLERWPSVHINPLGGETRYLYDGLGRLAEVERSQTGELTTIGYGAGTLPAVFRPAAITTPDGARTRFSVSADDDVTQIVEPSGNVVGATYEPGAVNVASPGERPPKRIEDSIGLVSEATYGADGRPVQVDLPEGETANASWQGAIMTTLTDPTGITTTFNSYGIHGHWIDATVPSTYFPVRRAFDPVGNLLVSAAGLQDGGVLDRSYDESRNVREIHVAATEAGLVTSEDRVTFTRRSDGRPLSIARPLGADHAFVYDALGRLGILRERVDGAWQDTTFEYDAAGNVTARERPNGMREELGYDAYGRLTRRAALRDGVLEGEALVGWAAGLPVSFWDSVRGVAETYSYDAAGRLAGVAYSSGESATLAYDARSRVTEVVYSVPGQPDHSVSYEYDAADRQTRATVDGSETVAELVYAGGRQVSVRYGNGLVRDAQYDPASGRLTGFSTADAAQGFVERTIVERTVDSERFLTSSVTITPLGTTYENYSMGLAGLLGDVNRRVGNRVWGWEDGQGGEKTYVYDGLSNFLSNTDGDSFVYNAERNRLLSATLAHEATTVSYAYDEAGFVTSRNGTALTWTATGCLAAYGPISIAWDMADRPISITIAGQTRSFGLFGGAVEADPQMGGIASVDLGVARISFVSSERLYRHRDFRGNVSFVSDETGAVVAHYRYSAYGLDAVLGADADAHRFAGRLEAGDGLVLMGARIYDQYAGRFLSQDPVFQALNPYSYTLGNPLDFWDPDGAHPQTVAEAQAALNDAQSELAFAFAALVLASATALSFGGPIAVAGASLALGYAAYKIKELEEAEAALRDAQRPEGVAAPESDLSGFGGSGVGGGFQSLASFGSGPCTSRCGPGSAPPPSPSWPEGVNSGCAPAKLASSVPGTPMAPWLLGLLVPLQLSLGALMLRRRRKRH